MKARSARLAAWLVALLLSLPLFFEGRVHRASGDAAFLRSTSAGVLVRLAGEFPRPGIYRFRDGATVTGVTKMTLPVTVSPAFRGVSGGTVVVTGDILTLSRQPQGAPVVSRASMRSSEKMLLGIPLDPDAMDLSDWRSLPGIGPVLAARIVEDRQENGAFGSVEGVLRVRGIGPGKLARIRKYF